MWPASPRSRRSGRRAIPKRPIYIKLSWPAAALAFGAACLLWLALNWFVQAARKPSELAGLLDPLFYKSPERTWEAYGPLFEAHATETMTPELLAALAQAESGGNPVARTYWRWRWTLHPFQAFAPASSAVGLYQITDGAFERCRRLCVRRGRVAEAGSWYDPEACWFNRFYNRLIPSHAVELTAACLQRQVDRILKETRPRLVTPGAKQDLAAIAHLCGPGAAQEYAHRGLRFARGQRCADHDPTAYLARVQSLKAAFARLRRAPTRNS